MMTTIEYKGFKGSVNYAANDRVFFGKLEEVNNLITFEGSSLDELQESFKHAVDEHISNRTLTN
jgi:predicted HicB family RNase H-like nuclease